LFEGIAHSSIIGIPFKTVGFAYFKEIPPLLEFQKKREDRSFGILGNH
jgi:hypothetical protein